MASGRHEFEVTVDRHEGESVVLRLRDGREIVWPASELPGTPVDGTTLRVATMTDPATTDDRRAIARDLLNEIFADEER